MMRRYISQGLLTKIGAVAVAAVVATAVTAAIVTVVASAADLIWIFKMRSASPGLKSIYGFDFDQSIGEWPSRLIGDLVFGSVLAIIAGFVGAFVFLAAGFAFVRNRHPKRQIYVWTGAAVGFAHSVVGLFLRIVDQHVGFGSGWDDVTRSIGGWGGFFLTSSPRIEVAVATFPASCVAGAIAGLVYANIVRNAPESVRV